MIKVLRSTIASRQGVGLSAEFLTRWKGTEVPVLRLFLLGERTVRRFDFRRNHHSLLELLAIRKNAARHADQYGRGAREVNDKIEHWHRKTPTHEFEMNRAVY